MNRLFCQTHTVRYDECDCNGSLTPTSFVRYMQDIAARDAEDAQLDGDGFWVVRRTVISFLAPVAVHTTLVLQTYGIGFTRITAQRGYEARLAGEGHERAVISARTLWVYVDASGRPARLPARTERIWLPDGPCPQRAETPLPASPGSEPETASEVVRFSDLDLMRHMNNASTVEVLDNAAWEAYARRGITPASTRFAVQHYDIEYADSPRFADRLEIQSWFDPLPAAGHEHTRLQQVSREGKVVVRAHSRWLASSVVREQHDVTL